MLGLEGLWSFWKHVLTIPGSRLSREGWMWQPWSLHGHPAPLTAPSGAEPSSSGPAGAASAKGINWEKGSETV